jgi:hypothetical protein
LLECGPEEQVEKSLEVGNTIKVLSQKFMQLHYTSLLIYQLDRSALGASIERNSKACEQLNKKCIALLLSGQGI